MRFAVFYAVPADLALPAAIPFSRFEGLVSCRLFDLDPPTGSVYLEAVWTDEEAFSAWESAFKKWLAAETHVNLTDVVDRFREKQSRAPADTKRWWKDWKNLWLVVANLGTFVAFVQIVQTQTDLVFATPDVGILGPNNRIEAFEGELVDLDVQIRNYSSRGSVRVRVNELKIESTEPIDASHDVVLINSDTHFLIPHLASGYTERIPGQWNAGSPGTYKVIVGLTIQGGLQSANQEFQGRTIEVFRDLKRGAATLEQGNQSGPVASAIIKLPLSHGERRIRCQLDCLSPRVLMTRVVSRYVEAPIEVEDSGKESGSRAIWETSTIPFRTILLIRVELEARRTSPEASPPALNESEWRKAVANVKLYAEEAKEE